MFELVISKLNKVKDEISDNLATVATNWTQDDYDSQSERQISDLTDAINHLSKLNVTAFIQLKPFLGSIDDMRKSIAKMPLVQIEDLDDKIEVNVNFEDEVYDTIEHYIKDGDYTYLGLIQPEYNDRGDCHTLFFQKRHSESK